MEKDDLDNEKKKLEIEKLKAEIEKVKTDSKFLHKAIPLLPALLQLLGTIGTIFIIIITYNRLEDAGFFEIRQKVLQIQNDSLSHIAKHIEGEISQLNERRG